MTKDDKLELAVELAAKVRGYFTGRHGNVGIPAVLTGDRDLYQLASRITTRSAQPGEKFSKSVRSSLRQPAA